MFDFGFGEIIMVMVIALIVVGPERLPSLARTAGFWVGKAKRFVTEVKSDIDRELAAEQLKKTLDDQSTFQDVYDIMEDTKQVGRELKQSYEREDSEPESSADTGTTTDNKNNKS